MPDSVLAMIYGSRQGIMLGLHRHEPAWDVRVTGPAGQVLEGTALLWAAP